MSRCLIVLLLLCCATAPVLAAENLDFRAPAGPDGPLTATAMRSLAVRVLPVYQNPDRAQFLANLSALQMVAGDYVAANATRESLDELRRRRKAGPLIDLSIIYDIYSRARALEVKNHGTFEHAFTDVFHRSVSPLGDLQAFTVTRWLATPLGVFRSNFQNELDRVRGEQRISVSQAVDLVWAYLSFDAFRSFSEVAGPLIAEDDRRRYVIDDQVLVRTPERASISAVLVRPRTAPSLLPGLLEFTTSVGSIYDAMDCAAHGYAGVIAYARGRARSPDALVPYEHDGDDARAVVAWIARQKWSNGSVGMYGTGYAGFAAWAAAKRPSTALKALAASSPYVPGLAAPARDRVPGLAASIYRRWLRHPSFDHYWQTMVPYADDFAHIDIPVLATTGYFDPRGPDTMYYFIEHLRQNPEANQTLLIGPYDDEAMRRGPLGVIGGYTLDPAALVDLKALRFQWFDHVLKSGATPELLAGRINFQVMGANTWRHAASIDQMANGAFRLYLDPHRAGGHFRLSGHSPSTKRYIELQIPLEDSVAPPDETAPSDAAASGASAPIEVISRDIASADSVTFVSGPLQRPMVMSGNVSGLLSFATNQHRLGVDLTLYELLPNGDYFKLFAPPDDLDLLEVPLHGHARPIRPKRVERFPFRGERLTSVELKTGAQLVLVLAVQAPVADSTKQPPLDVRWYGGSYIELPIERSAESNPAGQPTAVPAASQPAHEPVRPASPPRR